MMIALPARTMARAQANQSVQSVKKASDLTTAASVRIARQRVARRSAASAMTQTSALNADMVSTSTGLFSQFSARVAVKN